MIMNSNYHLLYFLSFEFSAKTQQVARIISRYHHQKCINKFLDNMLYTSRVGGNDFSNTDEIKEYYFHLE